MTPRGRRIAVTVVAFGLLVFFGLTSFYARVSWRRVEEWLVAHEAAGEPERDWSREAVWGETRAGSAFDEYRRAVKLASPVLEQFGPAGETQGPVECARPGAAALERLSAGARCADGRPQELSRWLQEATVNDVLPSFCWLPYIAMAAAHDALVAGDASRTAELWLDAATFGVDWIASGDLMNTILGLQMLDAVASALGCTSTVEGGDGVVRIHHLALGSLDADALQLLARALPRLESRLPDPDTMPLEIRTTAEDLLLGKPRKELVFAFDQLLVLAERYDQMHNWPDRDALMKAHADDFMPGRNFLAAFLENGARREVAVRGAHARIRLVRMAVDHVRGVEVVPLPDPFVRVGTLTVTLRGELIEFASAGTSETGPIRIAVRR